MRKLNIIVAVEANFGIGLKNDLPWQLRKEFQYFKNRIRVVKDPSKRNAVVMARKTWESVPKQFRPMKGLINVIVTRQQDFVAEGADVHVVHSLEEALQLVSSGPLADGVETVWNTGGSSLYKEAIDKGYVDKLFITRIRKNYDVDTYFPKWNEEDYVEISEEGVPTEVQEEKGVEWTYHVYQAKQAAESATTNADTC